MRNCITGRDVSHILFVTLESRTHNDQGACVGYNRLHPDYEPPRVLWCLRSTSRYRSAELAWLATLASVFYY